MKIAIASDHGGFDFKETLKQHLNDQNFEVIDFGCNNKESCDYPDFGRPAAESVANGTNDRAILICTNGIGMCMLANKIHGIRGALVYNVRTAEMTRRHHNSNVLCLGGQEFPIEELLQMADVWLETEFDGGRHERRINKVLALDGEE
ncbi:ribose 5-phosphate isomerase B [candidate division KSB1 bacterium]|nr:ribose 5-phosphate isomerase B [candidate division KSB1 bacterium]